MSGAGRYPRWRPGIELREDWLASVSEEIIDPDREIVDPHHHLWRHGDAVYELDVLAKDTGSGHNVVQTIYIECRSYYDQDAPEHLKPVGETRRVAEMAATVPSGSAQIAGIVAFADLRRADLGETLDAHEEAGQGRLVGIRHAGARDSDPDALMIPGRGDAGLYADPAFRRGVAMLGARGLTYDTWHYHHQAEDFLALARAVPETTLVLDHFGTPLGVGRFKGRRDEIFRTWRDDMASLSGCSNVVAKLGGLSMPDNGWNWDSRDRPPSSDEMVECQGDWYHHMIECFGPARCMFESNFPVDRVSISYPVLWNAFKKMAARYSPEDQTRMFSETARQTYRI
ncbi:amidohydrolase family protein [Sedimentitalea sp. JM2-8]|uniref:Amidohydrolase family protein n=1 Tax=Sedimentitalea xiamensis TaxID=3050037 RepID=A0ABT7FC12_9RHOB|nr:amidohydrolase family protein [Sedimentitalea xiamensis]MDK3072654.1 amidohydrolase family protein [Sedimentitalea xiamensis]